MSSLAAPDFTAPPRSERPPPVMPAVVTPARPPAFQQTSFDPDDLAYPHPKRRWGLVAGTLLLLGGGTAAAFAVGIPQKYMAHSPPPGAEVQAAQPPQERPAPAAPIPEPTPTPPPEPETTAEAAPAAALAAPKAAAAAPTPQPAQRPAWSSNSETRSASRNDRGTRAADEEEEDDGTAAAIEIRTPSSSSLNEAMAADAKRSETAKPADTETSEPASEPTPSGGAFDRAAAVAALGSAATSAQSCKMLGGPTGTGQAMVTFAPSGRVTSASVSGDFAGSTVGGCVARLFRNARVPAFSGEAVTVKKSFSIE